MLPEASFGIPKKEKDPYLTTLMSFKGPIKTLQFFDELKC